MEYFPRRKIEKRLFSPITLGLGVGAAALTVCAGSLIGALMLFSPKQTNPPIPTTSIVYQSTQEPIPLTTNTPIPTPTFTPTATAIPTHTPTPIPTNTPILDTPSGSILSLGQTWRQGYAGLTLTDVYYTFLWARNFPVSFSYRNFSDQTVVLGIYPELFSAIDNLGNIWPSKEIYGHSVNEVRPGDSYDSYVVFDVDKDYIARPDVNYLTITIDGLSSIQNAKWRIDIYH